MQDKASVKAEKRGQVRLPLLHCERLPGVLPTWHSYKYSEELEQERIILEGFLLCLTYDTTFKTLTIILRFKESTEQFLRIAYSDEQLPQSVQHICSSTKHLFDAMKSQDHSSMRFLTNGYLAFDP